MQKLEQETGLTTCYFYNTQVTSRDIYIANWVQNSNRFYCHLK